jgi:hypothetical protein
VVCAQPAAAFNCAVLWPMSQIVRIHIVCPGDEVNGSAESLHQFGRVAAMLGYDTRIAYEPFDILGPVVSAFRGYGVRPDQAVLDDPDVTVLVPQNAAHLVAHLTRVRKVVWWLRIEDDADVAAVTAAAPGAVHLAQSEYARRFLELHGVIAPVVGDYVHPNFVARAATFAPAQRLDSVLYNPDPSDRLTPKLIEASRDVLQWVPIAGLSRDEVAEIMAYSKVYVDFGGHPGRCRLPREALAAGCCVITGRRGAAGNAVDLPLPDGFTFDEADPGIVRAVLNRIALTIGEFDDAQDAFAAARSAVNGEEADTATAVQDLLSVPAARPIVGVGVDQKSGSRRA